MSSQAPWRYSQKLRFLIDALRHVREASDAAVLGCLVDHAHPVTGSCFVGLPLIVTEAGVPRSTTITALKRLQAGGWIVTEERPGRSTIYSLTHSVHGTGTHSVGGTGQRRSTHSVGGLRKGLTHSVHGTPPIPSAEHEQEEKEELEEEEQKICVLRTLEEKTDGVFLILKNGSPYPISDALQAMLRKNFPTVDVDQELRSASAWCDAKPAKRKTERGVKTFLVGWMTRALKDRKQQPNARTAGGMVPRSTLTEEQMLALMDDQEAA